MSLPNLKSIARDLSHVALLYDASGSRLLGLGCKRSIEIGGDLKGIKTLEALEELYLGIRLACKNYEIDMIGGDTSSSSKGLMISITAIGQARKEKIT